MANEDDSDFASGMFAPDRGATELPRSPSGTIAVMAVSEPARSSAELEAIERAYFSDPVNALPLPFEDSAGNCERLLPLELEQLAAFNARFGTTWGEPEWRALHGYPPIEQGGTDGQPTNNP